MRSNIIKIKDYFPHKKGGDDVDGLLRQDENVSTLKNMEIILYITE